MEHTLEQYKLVNGHFDGAVEYGRLTSVGIEIGGWAAVRGSFKAPSAIVVSASNRSLQRLKPDNKRLDLPFADSNAMYGFNTKIDIEEIPAPLDISVDIFAIDEEAGIATKLTKILPNYKIDLPIRTAEDFRRLIQQPSTRITDPDTLAYAALHAAERFSANSNLHVNIYDSYVSRSSAACVLGYRLLETEQPNAELLSRFEQLARELAEDTPSIQRGVYLRWNISLRLISAYWAIRKKDFELANTHLREIYLFASELDQWPSAVSNILIAIFLLGFLAFHSGDKDTAIEWWSQAESVQKNGMSVALLTNFYAYEELRNAITIAQECFVGCLIAKGNGSRNEDPENGPIGCTIELTRISNFNISGGLLVKLLNSITVMGSPHRP